MPLTGKKVALTGSLVEMSRADFKKAVAEANGTYTTALDEEVDFLVTGERPLRNRVDKAEQLGIEVLDEDALAAMLQGRALSTDGIEPEATEVPLAYETVAGAPPTLARLDAHRLRILDLVVPCRAKPGPLSPPLDLFGHYTLDGPTLRMLRFIARAVALRQPCLLEGETATSKTSAITFLAALTGHEVVRINLNGQSDTSELVGRYVPNEEKIRLNEEEMLEHLDLLEEESQRILTRARQEQRPLDAVERQQVAANERIIPPQWRFQEGLVPQAMRKGWWVILDEVNLAEPQVLERLNSVLERYPSLVLTEGPGTRMGPGGDVSVHPDFRIFATMNPAEYQGRSVLSPAYKDRWVATWQAENPGEVEYRQMLERVVFGKQPDVEIDGLPWLGPQDEEEPPCAALSQVPGLSDFLSRLAALHAGLVRMATPEDGKVPALGVTRRERYVFSRRGLLAVLDGLLQLRLCNPHTGEIIDFTEAPEVVAADALERTYLDRIRGEDDRQRVVQLLRTLGLHRETWLQRFEEA